MLTYASARDTLVAELRANAADHDAKRYDAIGRRFDRVEHEFPTGTAPELARLHIALTFWDGWIDARNNGWPRGPIGVTDWPVLARRVSGFLSCSTSSRVPIGRTTSAGTTPTPQLRAARTSAFPGSCGGSPEASDSITCTISGRGPRTTIASGLTRRIRSFIAQRS